MMSADDEGRPHGLWQNPVGKGRREKREERKQTTRSPRSVHRKRKKDSKKEKLDGDDHQGWR